MILKAKHHRFIYPFFKFYTRWLVKRNFNQKSIIGNYTDKGLPILLISNHSSWWDGFWALYLNIRHFKRKFHFMMLEEQLRKYWYFNYAGGFSVKKASRSVIETIYYTAELLNNKNNLVLMFPQGKIESIHQHTFSFEKGIERILSETTHSVQVIFLACLTDYFSNKKPGLYFYLKDFSGNNFHNLQEEYNKFFTDCLTQQANIEE